MAGHARTWGANVREWTDLKLPELLAAALERGRRRTLAAAASLQSPPYGLQGHGTVVR